MPSLSPRQGCLPRCRDERPPPPTGAGRPPNTWTSALTPGPESHLNPGASSESLSQSLAPPHGEVPRPTGTSETSRTASVSPGPKPGQKKPAEAAALLKARLRTPADPAPMLLRGPSGVTTPTPGPPGYGPGPRLQSVSTRRPGPQQSPRAQPQPAGGTARHTSRVGAAGVWAEAGGQDQDHRREPGTQPAPRSQGPLSKFLCPSRLKTSTPGLLQLWASLATPSPLPGAPPQDQCPRPSTRWGWQRPRWTRLIQGRWTVFWVVGVGGGTEPGKGEAAGPRSQGWKRQSTGMPGPPEASAPDSHPLLRAVCWLQKESIGSLPTKVNAISTAPLFH